MGNSSGVVVARVKRLREDQKKKLPPKNAEIIPFAALSVDETQSGLVGRMAAGNVYRGQWRVEGHDPRPISVMFLHETYDAQDFLAEADLLCALHHPNVAEFLGYFVERPRFGLAMEYLPLGNLYQHLFDSNHAPRVKLHFHSIVKIALDVASGMQYLHNEGFTHRDLQTKSVLLRYAHSGEYICKIGDFTVSKKNFAATTSAIYINGIPCYMAPEVVTSPNFTQKIDVFSFAMILYEITSGKSPQLSGYPTAWAATQAVLQGARPPLASHIPNFLADIIRACWEPSPEQRPDFASVLSMLEKCYPLAILQDLYNPKEDFAHTIFAACDPATGTVPWSTLKNLVPLQVPRVTAADLAYIRSSLGVTDDNAKVSVEQMRAFLQTNFLLQLDTQQVDASRFAGSRTSMLVKERTISSWRVEDVVKWLDTIGMGEYKALFRQHELDGVALLQLTGEFLKKMGVVPLGHRKTLIRRVSELVAPRPPRPKLLTARLPTNNYQDLPVVDKSKLSGPGVLLPSPLPLPTTPAPPSPSSPPSSTAPSKSPRPVAATVSGAGNRVHLSPPGPRAPAPTVSSVSAPAHAPTPAATPTSPRAPAVSPRGGAGGLSVRVLLPDRSVKTVNVDEATSAGLLLQLLRKKYAVLGATSEPGGIANFVLFESKNVLDERRLADDELLCALVRGWSGNAPRLVFKDANTPPPTVVKDSVRIKFVDSTTKLVNIDTATRVRDVCAALASRMDEMIKDRDAYRLWEKDATGWRQLHLDDNVMLVKAAWDPLARPPPQLVFSKTQPALV